MEFAICCGELAGPDATTDILRENDITIIETGANFFLNSDEEKIKQTMRTYVANGITVRSVHAPFSSDCNLSNFDESKKLTTLFKCWTQSSKFPSSADRRALKGKFKIATFLSAIFCTVLE